jgi:hypothetical protein
MMRTSDSTGSELRGFQMWQPESKYLKFGGLLMKLGLSSVINLGRHSQQSTFL